MNCRRQPKIISKLFFFSPNFLAFFEMKNNEITENFNVNFCQDISIEDGRIFKANKCNNNS